MDTAVKEQLQLNHISVRMWNIICSWAAFKPMLKHYAQAFYMAWLHLWPLWIHSLNAVKTLKVAAYSQGNCGPHFTPITDRYCMPVNSTTYLIF